jgi:hypothetical protein
MTFNELETAAVAARRAAKYGTFAHDRAVACDNIIDIARINADATIHVEKAAPVEDHERLALGSIGDLLANLGGTLDSGVLEARVTDWFVARGVRF